MSRASEWILINIPLEIHFTSEISLAAHRMKENAPRNDDIVFIKALPSPLFYQRDSRFYSQLHSDDERQTLTTQSTGSMGIAQKNGKINWSLSIAFAICAPLESFPMFLLYQFPTTSPAPIPFHLSVFLLCFYFLLRQCLTAAPFIEYSKVLMTHLCRYLLVLTKDISSHW